MYFPARLTTAEAGDLPEVLWAVLVLVVLLLILGYAVMKLLLVVAAVLAVVWLIGFFVRGAEGARWYRW